MKKCIHCNTLKDRSCFYKEPRNKDGIASCCKTCHKKKRRQNYLDNKDRDRSQAEAWRKANPETHRKAYKKYYYNNIEKEHVRSNYKRAKRIQRTVKWANKSKITEFYKEAQRLTKETGVLHNVDHILPLQGRLVSGLHVETNLQVIPASENLSKSNKYDPVNTNIGV